MLGALDNREERNRTAKAKAIATLQSITQDDLASDNVADHIKADAALLEYLRAIGHGDVADEYDAARERVSFWYE